MKCIYGFNEEFCDSIKSLISKYYKKVCGCFDCKVLEGTLYLIEKYNDLEQSDRVKLCNLLEDAGIKNTKSVVNDSGKHRFKCPVLNTYINTDCRVEGCKYFVDYKWCNNCVLSFMQNQDKSSLSAEEISFLYKIHINKVKSTYNDAITAIKRKVLNDTINAPRFVYYRSSKVCCVCECNIQKHLNRTGQLILPHNLVDNDLGVVYCSDACLSAKPKKLIELEMEFETSITYILMAALMSYKDIKSVLHILDLTPFLLERSCVRYLGDKPENILKSFC